MRGWLHSPLFYPKCQQPSSWSCKLDSAARSTVTSQDTLRDTRAARILPPGGLVIQSGGPLAAGAAHREDGRNAVKAREFVTAQGDEVEDRGGAPTELT
jgi:hypothetical protein